MIYSILSTHQLLTVLDTNGLDSTCTKCTKRKKLTPGPLVTKARLFVMLGVGIRDQRGDRRYFLEGRLCLVS